MGSDFSGIRSIITLRGITAVLFGLVALMWPGVTLEVLVLFFGMYALIDGLFALAFSVQGAVQGRFRIALMLEGLLGIGIGTLTFFWPHITALVALYCIGYWAVLTGIFEIIAGFELRRLVFREMLLIVIGALSIGTGILLFTFPEQTAILFIRILGVYALAFGLMLSTLAYRLRKRHHHHTLHPTA